MVPVLAQQTLGGPPARALGRRGGPWRGCPRLARERAGPESEQFLQRPRERHPIAGQLPLPAPETACCEREIEPDGSLAQLAFDRCSLDGQSDDVADGLEEAHVVVGEGPGVAGVRSKSTPGSVLPSDHHRDPAAHLGAVVGGCGNESALGLEIRSDDRRSQHERVTRLGGSPGGHCHPLQIGWKRRSGRPARQHGPGTRATRA